MVTTAKQVFLQVLQPRSQDHFPFCQREMALGTRLQVLYTKGFSGSSHIFALLNNNVGYTTETNYGILAVAIY